MVFWVESMISAPIPNCAPSVNCVLALTYDDCRIHLIHEPHRRRVVLRDDRVRMAGAVTPDVLERIVERADDLDGRDQRQELVAQSHRVRQCSSYEF